MTNAPTVPRPGTIQVMEDPGRVRTALSPIRRRLLRELRQPASASGLAPRLGISRQRINYHLRKLEDEGLVRVVETRQKRGFRERVLEAVARSWVVDPALLGDLPDDPGTTRDRFSSAYLVAAAGACVRDVTALRHEAARAGKGLGTATHEAEIAFRSPRELRAFTEELTDAIGALVAKYHHEDGEESRAFHLLLGLYPERETPEGERPDGHEAEPEGG